MIKAILFDIDGTLLDTTEFIIQATEFTLKKYKIAVPEREIIKSFIGDTLRNFYLNFAPNGNFDDFYQTHSAFQLENPHLVEMFPEVLETLKSLKEKGYKLAAITSKHRDTLDQSLENSGLDQYFDLVISADDVQNHKPDPEGLLKTLKHFNLKPDEAIMVGDSVFDIEAGKAAGVKTIGVTYGFGKNLKKIKPDYLIHNLKELFKILL